MVISFSYFSNNAAPGRLCSVEAQPQLKILLEMLLIITEKQGCFGVSSAFSNIWVPFGRTRVYFQGNNATLEMKHHYGQ